MKYIKLANWVIFSLVILTSCNGEKSKKNTETVDAFVSKIEVIDFHSTHRCMTCKAIEANTQYTLNTYFPKEITDGKITFQTINVDEKENYALAEKFEAAGTSLFLNVISKGKEHSIDLTNFAFAKGTDKDAFSKELKTKIENELKKL